MSDLGWKKAKDLGLKRYISDAPCKAGHVGERYVSSKQCCLCNADRLRLAYSEKHDTFLAYRKAYRERHPDRVAEQKRASAARNSQATKQRNSDYYAMHREKLREASRARYHANRAHVLAQKRAFGLENKERLRPVKLAKTHKRQADKARRTPTWFGEFDDLVWQEAAHLAAMRAQATGFKWHVDHMIPLRSRHASGLHVAQNCQVIPAAMNVSKGAKMVLTQPLEWLAILSEKQ